MSEFERNEKTEKQKNYYDNNVILIKANRFEDYINLIIFVWNIYWITDKICKPLEQNFTSLNTTDV